MDRELEFEVWRQCNMIGVRGADPYGLAVPLIDAGHQVRLVTQKKKTVDYGRWIRRLRAARRSGVHFSPQEIRLSLFGVRDNQRRALNRGLSVQYKRPVVEDILRAIGGDSVPIPLVHMGVIHSLDIPHWVVVTDADNEKIVFNDPYPPKGKKGLQLPHAKFQKILDDVGTRIGLTPSILFVRRG